MADLAVTARIYAPDGWHALQDVVNGYELHPDSFAAASSPRRNMMIDGDWVDGSWATRSTLGNVVESVSVWCSGSTAHQFRTRFEALKSWFDQISYTLEVTFDDVTETWSCPQPGEYTWDLNQSLRFATSGLLKVQVARLPALVIA